LQCAAFHKRVDAVFGEESKVGPQHQEQVEAGDAEQAEAQGQPRDEHGPRRVAEPM
jgi:hypothetical protein